MGNPIVSQAQNIPSLVSQVNAMGPKPSPVQNPLANPLDAQSADQAAIEKDLDARRIGEGKLKAMIDSENMGAYDMARQKARGTRVMYGDRNPGNRNSGMSQMNLVLGPESSLMLPKRFASGSMESNSILGSL